MKIIDRREKQKTKKRQKTKKKSGDTSYNESVRAKLFCCAFMLRCFKFKLKHLI